MNSIMTTVSKCGAQLGQYILTVKQTPIDLLYTEKVATDRLRPSRPFYRYSIEPIRVIRTEWIESPNDITVIKFNDDDKLRLRVMGTDDFGKLIPAPTTTTIREAISKQKENNEPVIFVDYPALVREITALNNESRMMMDSFVKELMTQMATIESANEAEKTSCRAAMKELGITDLNL